MFQLPWVRPGTAVFGRMDRRKPSSGYRILPLDNFGTVKFTNCAATINGTTGPIDTWQSYAIDIASGSSVQDTTSALTDSGSASSFTVAYGAGTTPTPTSPTSPTTPTTPTTTVSTTTTPIATTSTNWSGYAVSGAADSVSKVAGTWTVPTVSTSTNGYSAVWVGIDGYSSSSVEQIGTGKEVYGGKASYYAWYEMYPSAW